VLLSVGVLVALAVLVEETLLVVVDDEDV